MGGIGDSDCSLDQVEVVRRDDLEFIVQFLRISYSMSNINNVNLYNELTLSSCKDHPVRSRQ